MRLHSVIHNPPSAIRKRAGLSLTEVLLAMFVMAIGMISLLVLFPIGMLNMAEAMRSSRYAYVAADAEAQVEMPRFSATGTYTIRTDTLIPTSLMNVAIANQNTTAGLDAYNAAGPFFDNTTNPPPPSPWYPWLFDINLAGPPVFVDPQGQSLWPNRTIGTSTGNVPVTVRHKAGTQIRSFGIRRVGVSFVSSVAEIRRTFSLEDELTFEANGEVRRSPVSGFIERERNHSWAYMWRRPRFAEINVADMATVIFQGRQLRGRSDFTAGTAELSDPPEPFFKGFSSPALDPGYVTGNCDLAFKFGSTTARLVFDATVRPTIPVKRGDWVLDATVIPPRPNANPALSIPAHFNGYFYKVVGVGEPQPTNVNPNEFYQELELSRPAINDGYIGVMITGVGDVVEKNDGRMPAR